MNAALDELARKLGPAALIGLILMVGIWTWSRTSSAAGSDAAGFHVKCTAPDCGADFVIARDDIHDHPRGSHGEGLQCTKCDRFSARLAQHCPRCDRWYAQHSASDDASRCPSCYPAPAAAPAAGRRG